MIFIKKKIITITILSILIILAFIYLIYINTHKSQGTYDFSRIDIIFSERINSEKVTSSKKVTTKNIIEEDYQKEFETENIEVLVQTKSSGNVELIEVIPDRDVLGVYKILNEKDTGYGIFSYYSQGKGEEIYRAYLKNESVIATKDIEKNELHKDKLQLDENKILNIQKLYKYYINLEK